MNLLITGGLGYVGGRLSKYLADFSYQVLVGTRKKRERISWLPTGKLVQIDWQSKKCLKEICKNVDVIIHAAGMNAQECLQDPVAAMECNALYTASLLQAALFQNVRRFVYFSTAHVYASPLVGKITEDLCTQNLHPYASSHRAGEDVVRAVHNQGDIEGVVIRLSNSYGAPIFPQANCWMLIINDICRQAVISHKIKLKSSGNQQRNFIPMTEVCRATTHLLGLPSKNLGDGVFNVGWTKSWSIMEMANCVSLRAEKIMGKKVEIVCQIDSNNENIKSLEYDTSKLLKSGFQVGGQGPIETEIDNLIYFCLEHFNKN